MREIRFRGKTKCGEWVYGYLDATTYQDLVVIHSEATPYEVVPDTVGQYSGLDDKNGNPIYEGDIVRTPYVDPIFGDLVQAGEGVDSEVCFHDGSFVIKYDDGFYYLDAFTRHGNAEIVGNKYQKA